MRGGGYPPGRRGRRCRNGSFLADRGGLVIWFWGFPSVFRAEWKGNEVF